MTTSKLRHKIIRFPRVATYPVGWTREEQTFAQIHENLAFYATNVMKGKGIGRTIYLPDCLQIGFMALWETLVADREFLAKKSRRQTVFFVLARCKISTLRHYDNRLDSFEQFVSYDWHSTWDEMTITGFTSATQWHNTAEHWATWAEAVDIRIDITDIMQQIIEKHADSFRSLIAIYTVTTHLKAKDTASLVGLSVDQWRRCYINPMRDIIRAEFAKVFLEVHEEESSYAMAAD